MMAGGWTSGACCAMCVEINFDEIICCKIYFYFEGNTMRAAGRVKNFEQKTSVYRQID